MRIPVSSAVLLAELEAAGSILAKWHAAVGAGIPCVDMPADEDALDGFMTELCGELLVVAGKCQTLAEVLYGRSA